MKPHPPRGGWRRAGLLVAAVLGACALWVWLAVSPADEPTALHSAVGSTEAATATAPMPQAASAAFGASAPAGSSGPPLSALGLAQRREQLQLWQGRLERARQTLAAYRAAAQYPHESRPIEEHPDQLRPFAPISEDRALRMPGGSTARGMRLRTTQERVFASGLESSRVTLTLQDDSGRTLPLRVLRAVQREVTAPGRTAVTADYAMPANDAGLAGDAVAGDGVFTAVMQPGAQGFGAFAGTVRLALDLEYAGQPGFIYFDLVYSPETAATWLPGVREAQSPASLDFFVKAQVLLPGRYVVSGRIDDARGQPLALAQFNAEVGAGPVEFRLPVAGKLIRDRQPAFPLVLRDVEAFLLKPDTFPDRVMLPRRAGEVHRSRSYALAAFSDAEWTSPERERYLTELDRDVVEAEAKVRQLGP